MMAAALSCTTAMLRLGSHIHNFELRRTATFEIGALDSELRPTLDHRKANCGGVSGCAALRRQASPVFSLHPDNFQRFKTIVFFCSNCHSSEDNLDHRNRIVIVSWFIVVR